ncbi:hypothetical protein BH11BAC4_BH11BAC4_22870 [soil metagenome]
MKRCESFTVYFLLLLQKSPGRAKRLTLNFAVLVEARQKKSPDKKLHPFFGKELRLSF